MSCFKFCPVCYKLYGISYLFKRNTFLNLAGSVSCASVRWLFYSFGEFPSSADVWSGPLVYSPVTSWCFGTLQYPPTGINEDFPSVLVIFVCLGFFCLLVCFCFGKGNTLTRQFKIEGYLSSHFQVSVYHFRDITVTGAQESCLLHILGQEWQASFLPYRMVPPIVGEASHFN